MSRLLVGLDIGGTKCAVIAGLMNEQGDITIEAREAFPTPKTQEEAIQHLGDLAERMTAGRKIAAIGISAGNPMDAEKGMLLNPPNLPGWTGISMTDRMTERFHAPARMENDANACALAEYRLGAGKGCTNMVFITFGTGFGAGLVLDGRLYRGTTGCAGELGHWRLSDDGPSGYGKLGSFEGFCSGGGMAQLAQTVALRYIQNGTPPDYQQYDVKTVAQAARAGDAAALEVFEICGNKLGQGLALVCDLLDVERIVLGSIYARCEDLLVKPMRKVLDRETLPNQTAVLPAALGEQIGDYAALTIAAMEVSQ
ncbi:MAG: ROK family protein [Clostridia bacterium]|nr:ROK family protein [Clostridia bacterium]